MDVNNRIRNMMNGLSPDGRSWENVTNHPAQGLQDMTLDLSTYSEAELSALQTRIEEEKTKRERKVPFEVYRIDGLELQVISKDVPTQFNTWLRLSAEAKLRAAGGGSFREDKSFQLNLCLGDAMAFSDTSPTQGAIYFNDVKQALSAYATLTPDEQAAIFGFGEG